MRNNTNPTRKTRRPSVATMEARLRDNGVVLPASRTIGELHAAFDALLDLGLAPVQAPAKPAKAKAKPAAAKPAKTPAAPSNCGCGCGAPAITSKARFLPGHDARLAGSIGRGLAEFAPGSDEHDALLAHPGLSDALRAKATKIEATARKANAIRQAKADAKAAYEAAIAAIG